MTLTPTFDRSYTKDILPEKLENYIKELESDIQLNEMNIRDKTLLKPSIAAKWARYSYEEERFKKKLTESLDMLKEQVAQKLYEKKKNCIMTQAITDVSIKLEVDKVIKKSSQYQKIKEDLDNQEDVLRFINEAKMILNSFGFDIKNTIDALKLESI